MTYRRSLDWSSALRDLGARRSSSPFLTASGRYDLRAIMQAAIVEARRIGRGLGLSWQRKMSLALRLVWDKARRATAAAPVRLAA